MISSFQLLLWSSFAFLKMAHAYSKSQKDICELFFSHLPRQQTQQKLQKYEDFKML